jgi:tripartite-type tricarboxylate transporter receptor subunit TctC
MKLLVAALFAFASWAAIAPGALIERLHHATAAALQSPEARERLPKLGAEPMAMTPGEFDALVREELRTNAVLVKAAGMKPN